MIELLLVTLALLQSPHPCDLPDVTGPITVFTTTVLKVQFCQKQDATIDAVTVYDNGAATNLTTLTTKFPTPNATGLILYEIVVGQLPIGTHNLQLSNWNKDQLGVAMESGRSNPLDLLAVVRKAPPEVPSVKRVGG